VEAKPLFYFFWLLSGIPLRSGAEQLVIPVNRDQQKRRKKMGGGGGGVPL